MGNGNESVQDPEVAFQIPDESALHGLLENAWQILTTR